MGRRRVEIITIMVIIMAANQSVARPIRYARTVCVRYIIGNGRTRRRTV